MRSRGSWASIGSSKRLPLLRNADATADRSYIEELIPARNREHGWKYGVEYAEAFHHIWPTTSRAVGDYLREDAVPSK
jgi:hypothetical protein